MVPPTDYVDDYLGRLRGLVGNRNITDVLLIDVAKRLGGARGTVPKYGYDANYREKLPTRHYRPPDQVGDDLLVAMLDEIDKELEPMRIRDGEPVGIVAAQSIGEPLSQTTLRTFHYAGVSAGPSMGDLGNALSNEFGVTSKNYFMAIALKPEFARSFSEAEQVAAKLMRTRFAEYVEVDAEEVTRFLEADVPFNTFLIRPRVRSAKDIWNGGSMTLAEIEATMNEYFMKLDGERRSGTGRVKHPMTGEDIELSWTFAPISIQSEMGAVRVSIPSDVSPHITPGLFTLSLMEAILDLEICNGCGYVSQRFTLEPPFHVSWRKIRTPLPKTGKAKDEYGEAVKRYADVVEGDEWEGDWFGEPLTNPVDEQESEGPTPSEMVSGFTERVVLDGISLTLQAREASMWKQCQRCGGGWRGISASAKWAGTGLDYEEFEASNVGKWDEKAEDTQEKGTTFQIATSEGLLYPESYGDYEFEGYSDTYMHVGRYPEAVNLDDGEWFVLAATKDPEIYGSGKWATGGKKVGHYANVLGMPTPTKKYPDARHPGLSEADAARSSCDDVWQVNSLLGIEAARSVLFKNLFTMLTSAEMGGLGLYVSPRHLLLFADAATSEGSLIGAPAASGSIVGIAARKGMGGASRAGEADVLSVYERHQYVLMQAAVHGLVDPLRHPKSAQTVGSLGGLTVSRPKKGRYSMPKLWEYIDVKREMERLEHELVLQFDRHPITEEPDMTWGWVTAGGRMVYGVPYYRDWKTKEVVKNEQWFGVRSSPKWAAIHEELIPLRKRYDDLVTELYDEVGLILKG